ncbi:MAG: hypothetical protein IPK52_16425 [Chloroflexi bacterium]|nr:hypothetical protein [Chloroflexota bacterium]
MTVAPDYRSWGDSEWGVSLFHGGLTVDVLNLISALETVPEADMSRIGMWGHSGRRHHHESACRRRPHRRGRALRHQQRG